MLNSATPMKICSMVTVLTVIAVVFGVTIFKSLSAVTPQNALQNNQTESTNQVYPVGRKCPVCLKSSTRSAYPPMATGCPSYPICDKLYQALRNLTRPTCPATTVCPPCPKVPCPKALPCPTCPIRQFHQAANLTRPTATVCPACPTCSAPPCQNCTNPRANPLPVACPTSQTQSTIDVCPTTPCPSAIPRPCPTQSTRTDIELSCIICRIRGYRAYMYEMQCAWPKNEKTQCKCLHLLGVRPVVFKTISESNKNALKALDMNECKVKQFNIKELNYQPQRNCFPESKCTNELFLDRPSNRTDDTQ